MVFPSIRISGRSFPAFFTNTAETFSPFTNGLVMSVTLSQSCSPLMAYFRLLPTFPNRVITASPTATSPKHITAMGPTTEPTVWASLQLSATSSFKAILIICLALQKYSSWWHRIWPFSSSITAFLKLSHWEEADSLQSVCKAHVKIFTSCGTDWTISTVPFHKPQTKANLLSSFNLLPINSFPIRTGNWVSNK